MVESLGTLDAASVKASVQRRYLGFLDRTGV